MIIILLVILIKWFLPNIFNNQEILLNYIDKKIDIMQVKIHRAKKQKYIKYLPRWLYFFIFWLIINYIYIKTPILRILLEFTLCLMYIEVPLSRPWTHNLYDKNLSILKNWKNLFIFSGDNILNHLKKTQNSNFEESGEAIFKIWMNNFIFPLIFLIPKYGFVFFSFWVICKYILKNIEQNYILKKILYILEYIPSYIVLFISALIGNFVSCFSSAKQNTNYKSANNLQKWLWASIKGAINLDVLNTNYHFSEYLIFMSKLILSILVLYIFTYFI